MADAPIEACEQSGGLGRDDGGFEVGTGEGADGGEGAPGGLDENFGFACGVTHGNCCAEKAIDAAKFRQDGLGKVLEVFGQLRFGGAGRPMGPPIGGARAPSAGPSATASGATERIGVRIGLPSLPAATCNS